MKKVIAGLTALGMLALATPAFAAVNSSTITIGNTNSGTIDSDTNATASTGLNFAAGSTGGDGALGGAGGAGGNGGSGGLVVTGSATADAGAVNSLNSNDFRLRVTDGGMNSSTLDGTNSNTGDIDEDTDATANTGLNAAAGSTGGNG